MDLDQSGNPVQRLRVGLGPSLGDVILPVRPSQTITSGGPTALNGGSSLVLVNVADIVQIRLPDVTGWIQEFSYRPVTAFDRGIWVKDLGGNAASFNITVLPFDSQTIDTQLTAVITANYGILRFYPLFDLSGWFIG